jgi:hypothetical protein
VPVVPDAADEGSTVTSQDDDGGVLDELGEVVGVVLADDLGPQEPEDPWERRQRILDSWTAIILAVAAIVAAWGSFQASQWGGAQSDAQSKSAIARADAGRFATASTQDTVIDSQMWLSWLDAVNGKDTRKAGFLEKRFSPWLSRAQDEWLTGVQVDANGTPVVVPAGTPLDLPSYVVPSQVKSDANSAYAEAQLAYGDKAGSISTSYVLLAVLVALVLFFGSVALKFTSPRAQVGLTLAALLLLVLSTVRMFLLPQYVWGRPDPEPIKESYVSATK